MPRQEYPSLRQGLVGAWCPSLGASGYRLLDRSVKNAHGTLTNMDGQDNWRASGSAVALNFDGVNDYVTAPDRIGISGNSPFTVSAWVKTSLDGTIIDAGGAALPCLVRTRAAGTLVFCGGGPIVSKANGFAPNVFSHVAIAYPGTVVRDAMFFGGGVYLGTGVEENGAGSANTANNYSAQSALSIGVRSSFSGYLSGQLDDIRLYNRALTPAEIRLLASRRWIGLSPLPDRGGGLPRKLSVNVGGTWRAADAYVNVGGAWKLGQASVNIAGTWR